MQALESLVATAAARSLVAKLLQRIGPAVIRAGSGLEDFTASLDVPAEAVRRSDGDVALLIVDFPAGVVKQLDGETAEFGFVMPTAQIVKPWQRATAWRDDATLELWRAGWSPVAVDRIVIPTSESIVEFVIGNARRTPVVAVADTDSNTAAGATD